MQRTIYLSSADDLTYLAGALVHGSYTTKDYEHQTIYIDESQENKLKFNIRFITPEQKSLSEVFSCFK